MLACLFCHSLPLPSRWWWTKWKSVGDILLLGNYFWNTNMHLLFVMFLSLFHRYKSSSSGYWPQACTEGAWWSHSSVAQSSCPESHNHPGHMDGKCSLLFYTECNYIYLPQHFKQVHHFHLFSSRPFTGRTKIYVFCLWFALRCVFLDIWFCKIES